MRTGCWLAATLAVWALGMAAAYARTLPGSTISTHIEWPYTQLPNSCSNSQQCELNSFCNAEGVCEQKISGRVYAKLMGVASATSTGIFGGLGVAMMFLLTGLLISGALTLRCNDGQVVHAVLWLAASVLVFIIAGLALGLSLGLTRVNKSINPLGNGTACASPSALVCGAFYCDMRSQRCFTSCTHSAQCTAGSACYAGQCFTAHERRVFRPTQPRFSRGAVAGISIGCTLAVLLLPVLCSRMRARVARYISTSTVCATAAVVCIVLSTTLTAATKSATPLQIASVNSTACTSDRQCAPYLCDPSARRCTTSCRTAEHCVPTFGCAGGVCVRSFVAIQRNVFSAWSATLLALMLAVFAGAGAVIVCCICDDDPPFFGLCVLTVLVACVTAIVCGPLMGLAKRNHVADSPGTGANCTDLAALACAPYYCDLNVGRCMESCSSSQLCTPGTSCKAKACVASQALAPVGKKNSNLSPGIIAAIALLSPLPVLLFAFFLWLMRGGCTFDDSSSESDDSDAEARQSFVLFMIFGTGLWIPIIVGLSLWGTRLDVPSSPGGIIIVSRYPGWLAFVAALGCSMLACLLALIFIRLFARFNYNEPLLTMSDRALAKVLQYGVVLTCLFITCMICFGLGFGLWRKAITPAVGGLVNGTRCSLSWDSRCLPHACDMSRGWCYASCSSDAECISGSQCRNGTCAAAIERAPLLATSMTIIACLGASLGAFFCCCACLTGTRGWVPQRRFCAGFTPFRIPMIILVSLGFAGLVCALVTVPLVYSRTPVRPAPQPDPRTALPCNMINARQCEPYFCDVPAGLCYGACTTDAHCSSAENFACSAGRCVYRSPRDVRLASWLLALALVACVAAWVFVPRLLAWLARRRALAYEAANAAAEARRRAFLEQQAAIRKVQLDVVPAAIGTVVGYGAAGTSTAVGAAGVGVAGASAEAGAVRAGDDPFVPLEPGAAACVICFSGPAQVRLTACTCEHGYCLNCAREALEAMVATAQFPARCPGCRADEQEEDANAPAFVRSLVPSGLIERLAQRSMLAIEFARRFIGFQLMKALNPAELVRCPSCDLLAVKPVMADKRGLKRTLATCSNCQTDFCCECLICWFEHDGYDCAGLARAKMQGTDTATMNLLRASSKPCPSCGALISRFRGHACTYALLTMVDAAQDVALGRRS